MLKFIFFHLLLLSGFFTYSQVTFFGDAEPVSAVNSSVGENYLYIAPDGKSLFFTRQKDSQNAGGQADRGDIWQSNLDSGWTKPTNIAVNNKDFASPIGFSSSGQYFLFNKVRLEKGLYYGGVYAFDLSNPKKEWPVEVSYFKNRSPLQTGYISRNGKFILLSLENASGYGVDDLFVSIQQADGSWSLPRNLGHLVNTRFQEITPFLAADNKTLFYASNGRGGQGSFDIYMTVRQDDTWRNWSEPVNLGSEVNTIGAETSFVFNDGAEYAYFVSTQNSDGYGDVKRIKIKEEIEEEVIEEPIEPVAVVDTSQVEENDNRFVTFQFKNAKNEDSIAAVVLKKEVGQDGEVEIAQLSDSSFQYTAQLIPDQVLELEFKSKGYLSQEIAVGWQEVDSAEVRSIMLEPLESGNTITLKNVLFYRGTANFIEGSQRELDLVVEMMNENPDVNIFLKGHTDNVGNPVLNVQLSNERVNSVKEYLIRKGISRTRITGKGFGGSQPIASNENEETRKLNRRVEFEIRRDQ